MKRAPKGTGTYTKNPNGTWTLRKDVGRKTNGSRKIITATAKTKRECEELVTIKTLEWKNGCNKPAVDPLTCTLEELCKKHLASEKNFLEAKSYDRRECTIRNQIATATIGYIRITDLEEQDFLDFFKMLLETKLSLSTIEKALNEVNSALTWATKKKILSDNPFDTAEDEIRKKLAVLQKKESTDSEIIILTPSEKEKIVKVARAKDDESSYRHEIGLYFLVLLFTGMRLGELLALTWDDIDFEEGLISIKKSSTMARNRNRKSSKENKFEMVDKKTKTDSSRTIQMLPEAREVFQELRLLKYKGKPSDLFVTVKNKKNRTCTTQMFLSRAAKLYADAHIGKEGQCGVHILRHTFATDLYDRGARVEDVAAYIGDSTDTAIKYYIARSKRSTTKDISIIAVPTFYDKKEN